MKTIFTLFFSLLITTLIAQQKDVYLIDFHNNNEYFSILGKNVANEFENSLSLCKSKYRVIPRIKYSRQLEKKTFEETKLFLKDEGIDYVIYGDISKDDINNTYDIEYILEEVSTEKIILIETISFKSLSKLLNSTQRLKAIQAQLKYDDELCKKFTQKPKKPKVIDEGTGAKSDDDKSGDNSMNKDSDNDGVPDAIDKEINSPIGAIVDERGVEIRDAPLNPKTTAEKKAILEQLPDLPKIPFEADSTSIGEDAEMKVDQLARLLKIYPLIVVKLEGNDRDDIGIANQRAMTIKQHLMENYKLPERRFTVVSRKGIELNAEVICTIDIDKMDF